MNCSAFDSSVGDYVEGTLERATRDALDAHAAVCARCRSLAADLIAIRAAATALEPQRAPAGAWGRISAQISVERAAHESEAAKRLPSLPQPLAFAAIVLLATGVSWLAWRDLSMVRPPAVIATRSVPAATAPEQSVGGELEDAEAEYLEAIAGLEAITTPAASELDDVTGGELRSSLTLIDRAIGESRAALTSDPASELAQESLFNALRSKVVVLQDTVALLHTMRQDDPDAPMPESRQ